MDFLKVLYFFSLLELVGVLNHLETKKNLTFVINNFSFINYEPKSVA